MFLGLLCFRLAAGGSIVSGSGLAFNFLMVSGSWVAGQRFWVSSFGSFGLGAEGYVVSYVGALGLGFWGLVYYECVRVRREQVTL